MLGPQFNRTLLLMQHSRNANECAQRSLCVDGPVK